MHNFQEYICSWDEPLHLNDLYFYVHDIVPIVLGNWLNYFDHAWLQLNKRDLAPLKMQRRRYKQRFLLHIGLLHSNTTLRGDRFRGKFAFLRIWFVIITMFINIIGRLPLWVIVETGMGSRFLVCKPPVSHSHLSPTPADSVLSRRQPIHTG